jgi:hypothetical protein
VCAFWATEVPPDPFDTLYVDLRGRFSTVEDVLGAVLEQMLAAGATFTVMTAAEWDAVYGVLPQH